MIWKHTRGLETKKNVIFEQGLVEDEISPTGRGKLRCFITPMQWNHGYAAVISLVIESSRNNNKEFVIIFDKVLYDNKCKDARIADTLRYLCVDTMQEEQARFGVYDVFRYFVENNEEFRKLIPETVKRIDETRERHGGTKDVINEYKIRGAVQCPNCGKKLVVVSYETQLECLGCGDGWYVKDYERAMLALKKSVNTANK